MLRVIAYDIADDKRRYRLAKILKSYGYRVQESVFECNLNDKNLEALTKEMDKVLKSDDMVSIYQVCAQCLKKSTRWGKELEKQKNRGFLIIS